MFRPLVPPLLALLTLAGTASALAAEAQSPPAGGAAAPAVVQATTGPAADPTESQREISLLLVLAFASIGGGVGLIAAGRGAGAAEPRPGA